MIPELTIVIPTLNERNNIEPLVERLSLALDGTSWEVLFVDDDSRDGTLDVLHALSRRYAQIRFIRRVGRRGLTSACMEGLSASSAPYLAIMDADLQHDESLLSQMLAILKSGEAELVNGSRYISGGGVGEWNEGRQRLSHFGTRLGQAILKTRLTDPLSGFFMLRRELFDEAIDRMSGLGFKILLDLVSSLPRKVSVHELPYYFRKRHSGESKLDSLVSLEYLLLLLHKILGSYIPVRFLMFVAVGSTGMVVHLLVLGTLLNFLGLVFVWSQTAATVMAMISNYALNNLFTHRDMRLTGPTLLRGLVLFMLVSTIGALASISVATLLFDNGLIWWAAGLLGIGVGAVWNYAVSSVLVWSRIR
jgi:dolichol-phosphate mannosyltransferase